MKANEVAKELKKITANESTREFEEQVNSIIDSDTSNNKILVTTVEEMIKNKKYSDNKYNLFFIAATIHRRRYDYYALENLIYSHRDEYKSYISFKFVLNMFEKLTMLKEKGEAIIEEAYRISEKCPDNVGYKHNFAESVYMLLESCDTHDVDNIRAKWLDKAIESINSVIEESIEKPYAKFFATKARLLAQVGQYQQAYDEIERAKRVENSQASGYEMKILNYINSESKIQSLEAEDKLKAFYSQLEESKIEIKEKFAIERKRNVEYMGIFIAIISFIVGSVQIAIGQDFSTGSKLIVVFTFAVITMFSWFGLVLNMMENKWKSIICAGIAAIGMVALIYLVNYV